MSENLHRRYTDEKPRTKSARGVKAKPIDHSRDVIGVLGRSHVTPAMTFRYRNTDSLVFRIQVDVMRVADAVLNLLSPDSDAAYALAESLDALPHLVQYAKNAITTASFDGACEAVNNLITYISGRYVENLEALVKSVKYLIDGMRAGRASYADIGFRSSSGTMEYLRIYPKGSGGVEIALVNPKDAGVKARFAASSVTAPKVEAGADGGAKE